MTVNVLTKCASWTEVLLPLKPLETSMVTAVDRSRVKGRDSPEEKVRAIELC